MIEIPKTVQISSPRCLCSVPLILGSFVKARLQICPGKTPALCSKLVPAMSTSFDISHVTSSLGNEVAITNWHLARDLWRPRNHHVNRTHFMDSWCYAEVLLFAISSELLLLQEAEELRVKL